ncbi:Fc receptor-like protein 5 [Myripristis murdjan]|uniref:Fc receptor-like protein 5 n=1 Tax=Myripristis murdjan TaxID=586833 RepID=UPI00117639FE|nr:Fc receptor-like protein 5 [Myripristis murdjan]
MEVTAVCLTLVMNVLMLLLAQVHRGYFAQNSNPALLRVFPDRLQHFEYEEVSFSCEELDGSSGWRVMRMTNRIVKLCAPDWETSNEASCSIETAYPVVDSGKYWCENEKGQRSNAVSITVTAGSVILESPVLPVMEGSDVTLRCKTKTTPSSLTADFYKDGFLIRNSSTGEMTIHSISKSDEGFYKCSISDSGESPESWLDVGDAAFLSVNPNRLQLFEYEPASFNCVGLGGSSGWRVIREINKTIKKCAPEGELSSGASCTVENAYTAADSGKYWCENEKGTRSFTVNITVTGGSVILESPVLPVMEGSDVTLRCKTKMTPSNLTADFYKDGFHFGNGSTGETTIHSVSKSDEGFYKCSISETEESPESWLAVRGRYQNVSAQWNFASSVPALHEDTDSSVHVFVIRTAATCLLMAVLLVIGLLHCGKCRARSHTSGQAAL